MMVPNTNAGISASPIASLHNSNGEDSRSAPKIIGRLSARTFTRKFRNYILLTWSLPPIVGIGFLLFIDLFTPEQMLRILRHPFELLFTLLSILIPFFYFHRYIEPVRAHLAHPTSEKGVAAIACMRRFPLHYWTTFVLYLLMAPASVMIGAEHSAGMVPMLEDWFRIHLVALIVSIIVGLPIFFLILDLFGQSIAGAQMLRPQVTIKTKVFLIGALVPLLIDTMLVQYFWTRTGYFTIETFVMWLMLELLAIGGSLIFMRSFGQSLAPLQQVIDKGGTSIGIAGTIPGPRSTDELGMLAEDFRQLLCAREAAEQALHREKEMAQVTLASIGDGVITTDTAGRVRFLNAAAEDLTGWGQDEARGRPLREVFNIVSDTSHTPVADPLMRCFSDARVGDLATSTVLLQSDGREFAIEHSVAPIRDFQGETVGAVLVFRDVTRARELANRLSWQATHDSLSGLHNRAAFEERLRQLLSNPESDNPAHHVLLYIDLDQFKVVNDVAGHAAGDELLKRISRLMRGQIRESDMLARLGGDEFGLILTHCDLGNAQRIANSIHGVVESFKFQWADRAFWIGASIGLLEFHPGRYSINELLSAADLACYAAKNAGRRRTHIYIPEDESTRKQLNEMDWAARINDAIERDLLILHAQTIQPLNEWTAEDGLHFEVLVRMRDDSGQIIPPGVFLPAAERFDLMPTIDRWVVARAFSMIAGFISKDVVGRITRCAINLSGATLGDETFLSFIRNQLDSQRLLPEMICFEITETAAISNFSTALAFIQELRALGCRFALDDFGSGMSSFSYLRNLPVDYLKIDGAFVRDIANDSVNRSLVRSINEIGHQLGKQTIAEYAEDQTTIACLRELGVDFAQGFGIAKPRPLEDLLCAETTVRPAV